MDYRTIPNLNEDLSLLGFGCMRFPTINGAIDEEKAWEMLEYAYDNGVNYFDTAWPYHSGASEAFLGKFLKTKKRETFKVATKLPVWEVKKEEDVLELFNKQLSNLQVDTIDFYLLHALSEDKWETIKKYNIIDKCMKLKEEGRINHLGFSFHSELPLFKEIIDAHSWDFCLLQLNYMDTEHQQGLEGYNIAKNKSIPVFVMEPIKGGKLINISQDIKHEFQKVNPEDSAAKWALRFVASLDNVNVILSGMSTIDHVRENIEILTDVQPLNEEELNTISKVKQMIHDKTVVGCTGCDYCMPCPAGVNIPKNFDALNQYMMYSDQKGAKWEMSMLTKNNSFATSCVECGACEESCPQHIEIINQLKVVDSILSRL